MAQKAVLAYDLGGTKVSVGVVNHRGKILEELRVPVEVQKGKLGVLRQLAELGKKFLERHPEIERAGVASAGPLDPRRGLLLDPTNLVEPGGKSWGQVPLARILSQRLGIPVTLENDAAAAMLAEHWVGAAKGYDNAMILTLGTGLGTGIIVNGKLVRAGRFLHPEAGHLILNPTDATAPCGCGNLGCSEAYLSGRHFTIRARERLHKPTLSTVEIADLARHGEPLARELFDEYAEMMAVAIHNYAVIYSPEIVVFTGSFAATADLFLKRTERELLRRLARRRIGVDLMPRLAVSTLGNNAGLIGGAYVAFQSEFETGVEKGRTHAKMRASRPRRSTRVRVRAKKPTPRMATHRSSSRQ
jgi:glucokinase